jgi:murein DD-endopeptidase MepM/ murein hydrolase activator NlpD
VVDPDNITGLVLNGQTVNADIREALTSASVDRTLSGASTLSLDVHDPDRKLVTSRLFANRVAATIDKAVFDLVQVRKSRSILSLVFEDAVVADLRKDRTKPGQPTPSAKAGTTTIDAFARRLVAGAPGAKLVAFGGQKNLDALMRGSSQDRYEDSWTCLQRLAEERGWRCFTDRGTVYLGPETWLLTRQAKTVIREYQNGVEDIAWDFDSGKRASRASFRVASNRWQFGPGAPITVQEQGLGSGDWLVEETSRSLFDSMTDVTLIRAQKPLAEPKPEPRDDGDNRPAPTAAAGGKAVAGPVSAKGFQWPLSGPMTSGFGQRTSGFHAGIDIGVPIGTPVGAVADGTVIIAQEKVPGYGTVIYVQHGPNVVARYGHLSKLLVRRGQAVSRGERIGLSGNTGRSTGPHLHLELRVGGSAVNPLPYLPARR